MTEFIKDREIYEKVISGLIPKTKKFLWLATAALKDLHVDKMVKKSPSSKYCLIWSKRILR